MRASNDNASREASVSRPRFWCSHDNFNKIVASLEVVDTIFRKHGFGFKLCEKTFLYSILNTKGMNEEQLQHIFDVKREAYSSWHPKVLSIQDKRGNPTFTFIEYESAGTTA